MPVATPRVHRERPFSTEANPRYFYRAPQYDRVVQHVFSTVLDKLGLALVSGPVGSGKSTLFRYMVGQLEDELVDHLRLGILYNPNYTTDFGFLKAICREFGVVVNKARFSEVLEDFKSYLVDEADAGHTVVLLIDEAHKLTGGQLEMVREFFNFSRDDAFLLQVVLAGETKPLRKKLSYKPAVASRAAYIDTLEPLGLEAIGELVRFRLRTAGLSDAVFAPEALEVLLAASQGIPRTAVHLCRLTLDAYGDAVDTVTGAMMQAVVAVNPGIVSRNV